MTDSLPRFAATTAIEQIVGALREHGGVIVEGILDRDLLTRFNAAEGKL